MTLMLGIFVLGALFELAIYTTKSSVFKTIFIYLSTICLVFTSVSIVMIEPNGCTVFILLASIYRILNFARIISDRMQAHFLHFASRSASLWLIGLQFGLLGILYAIDTLSISPDILWLIYGVGFTAVAVILFLSLRRSLQKTRLVEPSRHLSDSELPTITVAIPARNETEALEACLRSVVANDYPKLEVIILDDCSQNKRTPEIIRDFAQHGVRFLAGKTPKDGWLAKNQAYQQLQDEANGEYIVFMGVDIELETTSLRLLISSLLDKQKIMMSVLPLRSLHDGSHYSITQPMRYFWELAPPRRLFNRPPVLSSCWIISRRKLQSYGGFKAVSNSIAPEAYFAKKALADNDGYTFARSDNYYGIRSTKSAEAQHHTAIRTRYPQLHRRIELVAIISVLEAAALLGPFFVLALSLWIALPYALIVMSVISICLLLLSASLIAYNTRINPVAFALVTFPFVVLNDLWLLHYSLYKYEFSTVEWKGRNVCIPVMQVIPHLPKLD